MPNKKAAIYQKACCQLNFEFTWAEQVRAFVQYLYSIAQLSTLVFHVSVVVEKPNELFVDISFYTHARRVCI